MHRLGTAKILTITGLHEIILLCIFRHLSIKELATVSCVCQRWYSLTRDSYLWKEVDLKPFATTIFRQSSILERIIKSKISSVRHLDISGFVLSGTMFDFLLKHCSNLRQLTLKSVKFNQDHKLGYSYKFIFPKQLHYLDLRYSKGDADIFLAIARNLHQTTSWLGISDSFLRVMPITEPRNCFSALNLRKLDFSQCLILNDQIVAKLACCSHLELLSLRKCFSVCGSTLHLVLRKCVKLRTLILDGTSISDDSLKSIEWQSVPLEHLELGWCPLVTSHGLKASLVQIAYIGTLRYLGLCSIGHGKALNDNILVTFAMTLPTNNILESINLRGSLNITDWSVHKILRCCSKLKLKNIDLSCCPKVNYSSFSESEFVPSVNFKTTKTNCDKSAHSLLSCSKNTRIGLECYSQFALSKYILETPV